MIVARAVRGERIRIISARRTSRGERTMNKKTEKRKQRDELRGEYDLPKLRDGVRGKYAVRYRAGTNIVLLSTDVAEHFPKERSVNSALRRLIRFAKRQPAHGRKA